MDPLWQWLQQQGASNDVVEWARPFEADVARLWDACPRGDWLLALGVRLGGERTALVLAASRCARLAFASLPEDEARPEAALEVCEAWTRGEAAAAACVAQRDVLNAALAEAVDPGSSAAVIAATAALEAIEQPDMAVNAAAFAVQAAVLDAGDCAMLEALRFAQHESAEAVRETIAAETAERWWQARASSGR